MSLGHINFISIFICRTLWYIHIHVCTYKSTLFISEFFFVFSVKIKRWMPPLGLAPNCSRSVLNEWIHFLSPTSQTDPVLLHTMSSKLHLADFVHSTFFGLSNFFNVHFIYRATVLLIKAYLSTRSSLINELGRDNLPVK